MQGSKDHHNRFGEIAFIFSMSVVFALIAYLSFFGKGVDLQEQVVDPKDLLNQPAVPVIANIDDVPEPWVANEKVVAFGKQLYGANCASCHGKTGHGDGSMGAALNPKPRNFVEGKWTQGDGVIAHYKVLVNGIPGSSMASFSATLKPSDRWAILQFIETITENKSKDDPAAIAEFAKTAK